MDMIDAKIFDERGKPTWPTMIRLRAVPRIGERITVAQPPQGYRKPIVKVFEVREVSHKIYGSAPINDHMVELKVALLSEVEQPK